MSSQVTLAYSVEPLAQSQSNIATAMAAVPVPADFLREFALRVTSDATPAANPVVRTIVIAFNPTVAATATATLAGTSVDHFTVTGAGQNYIRPPVVFLTGGGTPITDVPPKVLDGIIRKARGSAFLKLVGANSLVGGAGYSGATLVSLIGGLPPADINKPPFCVQSVFVKNGGRNYSANAKLQFNGALKPGGHQAAGKLTIVGGKITAVTLTDPGLLYQTIPEPFVWDPGPGTPPAFLGGGGDDAELVAECGSGTPAQAHATIGAGIITGIVIDSAGDGYIYVPTAVITDTGGGAGASFVANMGVGKIVVDAAGLGYSSTPSVVLVPLFQNLIPDTKGQDRPFFNLMTNAIRTTLATTVVAAAPVLA